MKAARLFLFALPMLVYAHAASAKARADLPEAPTPLGPPGSWLESNDYPAIALHFGMVGNTSFTLSVDATGKPSRCDITESSGFDLLDKATCERLMANARFSPARDRTGKPVEGTYRSRVRWVLPSSNKPAVSETFATMSLTIDQMGKITSCRTTLHVPTEMAIAHKSACEFPQSLPPTDLALEFRGSHAGPSAEVEFEMADAFTPELRARVLAPMPGYEQRGLNIHRFTVTRDGKLGSCSYEEQRGIDRLATDFCGTASGETFDPPFSAFDKDGVATGWHIMRVLLKTGQ